MRDPGLAAVLSAIIPGVRQFYNGRVLAGVLLLIITRRLCIGTGGLLGWVCHVSEARYLLDVGKVVFSEAQLQHPA
jgi:TM2 domain-containing membrane protein YozV